MTDKSLVIINGHIVHDSSKVYYYQKIEDISCGTICNIDISNITNNSHIIIGNGYIITTCQNSISHATVDTSNNLYENK
jgi:hypothetical protein